MAPAKGQIELLVKMLDQAYDQRAWHGTNLRGSLRGLDLATVRWRPRPGRHNIWEIALHTAYWKFCVRRHLTGDRSLKFPRKGSNWPQIVSPGDARQWKADVALLNSEHRALREAVLAFPAARLKDRPPKLKWRYEQYIYGAASHDVYHAGQIQLLKRLYRTRGGGRST
jgi:hypothetical protein